MNTKREHIDPKERFVGHPDEMRVIPPESSTCVCGHDRGAHVHGVGACLPEGAVCVNSCAEFTGDTSKDRQ